MRIGELLVEQRKLTPAELARMLSEQDRDRRRLVSLLIAAKVLDFDDGSRALGAQRGVPCVQTKHLSARDPELAKLITPDLARTWSALPIGRASNGMLIVCAKDPSPQMQTAISTAARTQVTLVVMPAERLDKLIDETYGSPAVEEFEVDFSSALEIPKPPPAPDMDALDPESVRLALTDLDDVRVAKDASASQQLASMGQRRATTLPPTPPSLAATREGLDRATTREAATDAAISFIAGNWIAGIVLAIRGTQAIGYRGHGAMIGQVETLAIELAQPSTVKNALETKRSSIRLYDSAAQKELGRRLASTALAAAPVVVGSHAVAAIVVGEPVHGLGDTERWIAELGRLAAMLGQAYERLSGGR